MQEYIPAFLVSVIAGFTVEAVIGIIVYLWKHRKKK